MKSFLQLLIFVVSFSFYGQNNKLTIKANLIPEHSLLKIKQQITYHNQSKDTLYEIVLRNWANSYKDNNTPLATRLLEDSTTKFYFSKRKDRGYSLIHTIKSNNQKTSFHSPKHIQDLVYVNLNTPLLPNTTTELDIDYTVKIPNYKLTGNGKKELDFYLKYWHITPAIYNSSWELNSHQNLNYQYKLPTDYFIEFKTPIGYNIHSNFQSKKTITGSNTIHLLHEKNITQTDLSINFLHSYHRIPTNTSEIITNFTSPEIPIEAQEVKIKQMMLFLNKYLGALPLQKILIEKKTYDQNPIYELKYLPNKLHPHDIKFKWEAEFFKAFVSQYLEQTTLINKTKDYWFIEGVEIYLFTKYINKYYSNTKLLGRLSKFWGLKSMHIAQQNFESKFNIIHQITSRENLDQKLNTPYNKLTNYNRKVISPYKAGLGFFLLEEYLSTATLDKSIYDFVTNEKTKATTANIFLNILKKNTSKEIQWFQKEWLNTQKKIDHKIISSTFNKDSIHLTLKNNRSITSPLLVYGLKGTTIKSKTWIKGFKNTKDVKIKNDDFDKVVLNYENLYPETNYRNNWCSKKTKLLKRPLQIGILKDLNNPRKNQLFLKPEVDYNYYDGLILGIALQNKAYLHQNLEYTLKPTYSTTSNSLTGGFNFNYSIFPEKTKLHKTSVGVSGSNYHYASNLNYNTISPYISLSFKQKELRSLGTNKITAKFSVIDREIAKGATKTDEDDYHLLNLAYQLRINRIITDFKLNVSTEIATKFSKLNIDLRYKHLTSKKRPIELRFYGGIFTNNNTINDYFSINQHTANDYLFELPYIGRSETSGVLSQQYFKSQGGFVSQKNSGFANQWLTSINTSVGIFKWIETFNNISLLKNKNTSPTFDYETGIRLNFIPNFLEVYLPIYNKEGLVGQQVNYLNTIRFVATLKPESIIRFLKRRLF